VFRSVGVLAVQVEANHHPGPTHSGAVGIGILTSGLALMAYGIIRMVRVRQWRSEASAVHGTVVDNVPQPDGRGKTTWLPVVEFEADGATIRSAVSAAATPQGWPLGDAVEMLYDPANPGRAKLADGGWTISWALIFGLAIIGIFLAAVT
jgi:Protein of unknown function (DUF3592)